MTNTLSEGSERLLDGYGKDVAAEYQWSIKKGRPCWKLIIPWVLAGFFDFSSGVLYLRAMTQSHFPGFDTDLRE